MVSPFWLGLELWCLSVLFDFCYLCLHCSSCSMVSSCKEPHALISAWSAASCRDPEQSRAHLMSFPLLRNCSLHSLLSNVWKQLPHALPPPHFMVVYPTRVSLVPVILTLPEVEVPCIVHNCFIYWYFIDLSP